MAKKYPIYGGPLSGLEAEESGTIYCDRETVPPVLESGEPESDELAHAYRYSLHEIGPGRRAFLPISDEDLRAAFLSTSGEPGDPESDALGAECERRNIDL